MSHLILFAHPNVTSFNHAILNTYRKTLEAKGETVVVRDLYRMQFQPVLSYEEYEQRQKGHYAKDVVKEQQYIEEARELTFIYPIWWGSFPAILKGYLDRVFADGFAFDLIGECPVPFLQEKRVHQIFTSGTPKAIYMENGVFHSMKTISDEAIFSFCGMDIGSVIYFSDVVQATDERRQEMLAKVERFADQLTKDTADNA